MKILVCVKQVGLLEDEVEFIEGDRAVDPDYLDWALNEWDAFANDAAIRLRERAAEGEVVVVSLGGDEAEAALRRCLAVGADRAIRIHAEAQDPITIGHALAAVVRDEAPDLVLCGVQSADSAQGATGGALAGIMDWPLATVVNGIEWDFGPTMTVQRELEGGILERVDLDVPAVVTIQTGTDELRYASLRAIKQAEAVVIDVVEPDLPATGAYAVREMREPQRAAGAALIEGSVTDIASRILELLTERRG